MPSFIEITGNKDVLISGEGVSEERLEEWAKIWSTVDEDRGLVRIAYNQRFVQFNPGEKIQRRCVSVGPKVEFEILPVNDTVGVINWAHVELKPTEVPFKKLAANFENCRGGYFQASITGWGEETMENQYTKDGLPLKKEGSLGTLKQEYRLEKGRYVLQEVEIMIPINNDSCIVFVSKSIPQGGFSSMTYASYDHLAGKRGYYDFCSLWSCRGKYNLPLDGFIDMIIAAQGKTFYLSHTDFSEKIRGFVDKVIITAEKHDGQVVLGMKREYTSRKGKELSGEDLDGVVEKYGRTFNRVFQITTGLATTVADFNLEDKEVTQTIIDKAQELVGFTKGV